LTPHARSTKSGERFVLKAATAKDVMAANPISLNSEALVGEARALFLAKGFSAAPVINPAGRPVGVLSRTDLLVHEREMVEYVPADENAPRTDTTTVAEVMTPVVFAVPTTMPMPEVINRMLELRVHRLFVLDETESLVGVISVLDILRHLEAE
jgi:CBS domain-containing protein